MRRSQFTAFLILLFVLAGAVLAACQPAAPQGPRLRITNEGPEALEDLVVLFPDQRIEFGDVPAGATSEYVVAPGGVYNYAAYEYSHNGQTVTQPVIDWVGETGRMEGDYTFVVSFDPTRSNMLAVEHIDTIVE